MNNTYIGVTKLLSPRWAILLSLGLMAGCTSMGHSDSVSCSTSKSAMSLPAISVPKAGANGHGTAKVAIGDVLKPTQDNAKMKIEYSLHSANKGKSAVAGLIDVNALATKHPEVFAAVLFAPKALEPLLADEKTRDEIMLWGQGCTSVSVWGEYGCGDDTVCIAAPDNNQQGYLPVVFVNSDSGSSASLKVTADGLAK